MSMKSICILGLFAALVAGCSTGTQQKKTDKCAAAGYFPLKDNDDDSVVQVPVSGVKAWKIDGLVRDIYVNHTSRDIDSLVSDDYCYDLGGLEVAVYYPGKVVRYEYDHGYAGARYSAAFNKLLELTGLEWRLPQ